MQTSVGRVVVHVPELAHMGLGVDLRVYDSRPSETWSSPTARANPVC